MFAVDYLSLVRGVKSIFIFLALGCIVKSICADSFKSLYKVKRLKIENHTKDFARYMVDKSLYGKLRLSFQIRFIEQTNLRKYWSWVSVKWCFLILVALYIGGFSLVYWKSGSFWLSGALASVGVLCPLVILDTLRQYNDQRTRGEMIHLMSLLGQWYVVTEDVIKSFEKASEHKLAEPLSTYIEDFVVQVHSGFEVPQALDLLNRKVESNFFNLFIVNIDQAIKNRGDVGIMLKNLEDEAYQLQEEFNRRRMSMVNDKIIIYCTMLLVLVIGYHFLVLNEVTEAFYFQTDLGRGLVVVFCILYLLGFFIAMGLSKLEY